MKLNNSLISDSKEKAKEIYREWFQEAHCERVVINPATRLQAGSENADFGETIHHLW